MHAEEVECPACGALPGERCKRAWRPLPLPQAHSLRWDRAKEVEAAIREVVEEVIGS